MQKAEGWEQVKETDYKTFTIFTSPFLNTGLINLKI